MEDKKETRGRGKSTKKTSEKKTVVDESTDLLEGELPSVSEKYADVLVKEAPVKNKVEVKKKYEFPNTIVRIEPIFRDGTFIPKNHPMHFLASGAKNQYSLPTDPMTNSFVNPFESPEQREALETALGRSLNPNLNKKESFFGKFFVKLDKDTYTLDLSSPKQLLYYLVLKANSDKFAANWEDRNRKLTYKYAIVEEGYKEKETLSKEAIYSEASERYNKIKNSHEDMRAYLISKGGQIAQHTKLDWMRARVFESMEANRKAFLIDTEDMETAKLKTLIYDAIKQQAIVRNSQGAFALPETPGAIAHSEGELITWLKDPKNTIEVAKIKHRAGHTK